MSHHLFVYPFPVSSYISSSIVLHCSSTFCRFQELDPGDKETKESLWATKLTKELGSVGYVRVSWKNAQYFDYFNNPVQ